MNFKKAQCVLCFSFLVLLIPTVTSHTMTDAKKLLADKLLGYEKTFRPIANQSAPVVLYIGLELVAIQEFDEVQEKLTITAVIVLNWADEYMQWNQSGYGGLQELVIESDTVWTPNLVLINNVEKLEKIGDAWHVIRFTPDGLSYYYPGDIFSGSCKVDVTYYPWDRHRCGFSFSAWAHSATEIIFQPIQNKVQTTYFSENGAWKFYNSSVETYYGNASIEFSLYLERKPRFVLVNVICPIIFMAFLNAMISAIPIESGERISYSITMLLAIAVFLTLVGDNLPKTSNPMSFFSYYLLVVLVISICIVLATICNVRMYYKDEEDSVPECLASLVRCVKCRCRNKGYNRKQNYQKTIRKRNGSMVRNISTQQKDIKYITNSGLRYVDSAENSAVSMKNMLHYPKSSHNTLLSDHSSDADTVDRDRVSGRLRYQKFSTDENVSWKDVSVTFNKIFFVLSFLIIAIATAVFFLYIFANR